MQAAKQNSRVSYGIQNKTQRRGKPQLKQRKQKAAADLCK